MRRNLSLAEQLVLLEPADRDGLLVHWAALFETEPPRTLSLGLLRRTIAHRLQTNSQGALRPALRQYLRQIAAFPTSEVKAAPTSSDKLIQGSRLIREWNGKAYEVTVEADGFRMDGKVYRSLSEIARTITGTAWSGPRFFGLVRRTAA